MFRKRHSVGFLLANAALSATCLATIASAVFSDTPAPVSSETTTSTTTTTTTTTSSAAAPATPVTTTTAPATAAPTTAVTTTTAPTTAAPASKQLTAGVNYFQLDLQELREVGLDLKRVHHAAADLYEEVNRHPVSLDEEPEVIGGTVIYIPISYQTGEVLPPRPKAVEAAMAAITPYVAVAKTNVDDIVAGRKELNLPENIKVRLHPQFQNWVDSVNSLNYHLQQLQPLTTGPNYDNQGISLTVIALENDLKALDKTRKEIYKVLQKEGKREGKVPSHRW